MYDPDLSPLDPDLRRLLATDLASSERWDALRFFLETGAERATMDEIALAAGRDSGTLLAALGDLAARGWLARRASGSETEYVLTQERERRALLDRLHAAMHDHATRLYALYGWTRGR